MEPKTNLNNTQRKMLDTIMSERIKKKVGSARSARQDKRNELVKSELAKAEKSKEVKEVQKLYKELKAKEKALREKGVKLSTSYDGTTKVELCGRYGDDNPPYPIVAFDKETEVLDEKISEATTEVRARIYGMDTSYDEVDKELKEMFSFLDK